MPREVTKHIYLSDFDDRKFFDEVIGEGIYAVFDKDKVTKEFRSNVRLDREVEDYLANIEITKSLARLLRNRKINNIVYLNYASMPMDVISSINNIVIPKIHDDIIPHYYIMTHKEDAKAFDYNKQKKRFADIYYRD